MDLPKNKLNPCNAKGGWLYVNRGSISIVAEARGSNIVTVTRKQLEAALKIMKGASRTSKTGK